MFHMPMSSPMMTTIFGCLSAAAAPDGAASPRANAPVVANMLNILCNFIVGSFPALMLLA